MRTAEGPSPMETSLMAITETPSKATTMASPFRKIDTIIIRVRNLAAAVSWYENLLGVEPIFHDAEAGLAVLPIGDSASLTVWQIQAEERPGTPAGRAGTYPIFAVDDIGAAHEFARKHACEVEPVQAGTGVQFFGFQDLDGNYLEACKVL